MAQGMDDFLQPEGGSVVVAFECEITTDGVNDPSDQVDAKEIAEGGNGFEHIDCRWEPRAEPDGSGGVQIRYPERGDRALVVVSDDNEPWIVEWTPYG